ncbi:hypothetical protein GUJ93_ZPchr0005g14521 [Zizania palustris]|uniref:Uncharacterized protein n=1 Tax=Zizania palustris TaxID=103762 RepID=A0A8J5S5Q2_ZIZPA|nr:hypothetical protein GUJ93_ZPchr0005g14521 [Zizania palustris]
MNQRTIFTFKGIKLFQISIDLTSLTPKDNKIINRFQSKIFCSNLLAHSVSPIININLIQQLMQLIPLIQILRNQSSFHSNTPTILTVNVTYNSHGITTTLKDLKEMNTKRNIINTDMSFQKITLFLEPTR